LQRYSVKAHLQSFAPAAISTATHPPSKAPHRSISSPIWTSPAATPAHRRATPRADWSAWPSTATGNPSAETGSTNNPSTAPSRLTCATCCGSCTTSTAPTTCSRKWGWTFRTRRNQPNARAFNTPSQPKHAARKQPFGRRFICDQRFAKKQGKPKLCGKQLGQAVRIRISSSQRSLNTASRQATSWPYLFRSSTPLGFFSETEPQCGSCRNLLLIQWHQSPDLPISKEICDQAGLYKHWRDTVPFGRLVVFRVGECNFHCSVGFMASPFNQQMGD